MFLDRSLILLTLIFFIDFIKNEGVPGVYVTYADKDKIKVFYGSRILQCKQLVDDFDVRRVYLKYTTEFGVNIKIDEESIMNHMEFKKNHGYEVVREYAAFLSKGKDKNPLPHEFS